MQVSVLSKETFRGAMELQCSGADQNQLYTRSSLQGWRASRFSNIPNPPESLRGFLFYTPSFFRREKKMR